MKSTELRLTNLVQDKLTGEVLVCSGIACRSDGSSPFIEFSVLDRSKYPLPDGWQAEPIPLTEEWLFKFGFEKGDFKNYIKKGDFTFDFLESSCLDIRQQLDVNDDSTIETIYLTKNIDYVHQLQNLYFALTGEELKIKE